MATNDLTPINATKEFEENCRPLLEELHKACFKAGVPFFFCAAVENGEREVQEGTEKVIKPITEYVADGILTGSTGINLAEDHIKHHMMIMDGCVAKPPREEIELSMDYFSGISE